MRLDGLEHQAVLGVVVVLSQELVDQELLIKVLLADQLPVLCQIIPAAVAAVQAQLVLHQCQVHLLAEMVVLVLLQLLQVHLLLELVAVVALLRPELAALVVQAAVAMAAPESVELGKAVQLTPGAAVAPDMSVQAQVVRV
jgi:hypothetical protein